MKYKDYRKDAIKKSLLDGKDSKEDPNKFYQDYFKPVLMSLGISEMYHDHFKDRNKELSDSERDFLDRLFEFINSPYDLTSIKERFNVEMQRGIGDKPGRGKGRCVINRIYEPFDEDLIDIYEKFEKIIGDKADFLEANEIYCDCCKRTIIKKLQSIDSIAFKQLSEKSRILEFISLYNERKSGALVTNALDFSNANNLQNNIMNIVNNILVNRNPAIQNIIRKENREINIAAKNFYRHNQRKKDKLENIRNEKIKNDFSESMIGGLQAIDNFEYSENTFNNEGKVEYWKAAFSDIKLD